jgi:hypothetical protein
MWPRQEVTDEYRLAEPPNNRTVMPAISKGTLSFFENSQHNFADALDADLRHLPFTRERNGWPSSTEPRLC